MPSGREKVESILLNDAVDGYLVTVAVPDTALNKNPRWHLGRKNEPKRRPGQPITTGIFAYPELLLCNPAKDGSLRYAYTGKLPFYGMQVK
jgi:hypothetical protein